MGESDDKEVDLLFPFITCMMSELGEYKISIKLFHNHITGQFSTCSNPLDSQQHSLNSRKNLNANLPKVRIRILIINMPMVSMVPP